MSKRDRIYEEFSENGYPDDPEKKKVFAARLLGARLVGALDSVIEEKIKQINGEASESENQFVQDLKDIDPNQRKAVEALLIDTVKTSFYWMLVKMNNFPGYLELNVLEYDQNDDLKVICDVGEDIELHHRYFDWVEEFSDYIDEA